MKREKGENLKKKRKTERTEREGQRQKERRVRNYSG